MLVRAAHEWRSWISAGSQNQKQICAKEQERRPEKVGHGGSHAKKPDKCRFAKQEADTHRGGRKKTIKDWSEHLTHKKSNKCRYRETLGRRAEEPEK